MRYSVFRVRSTPIKHLLAIAILIAGFSLNTGIALAPAAYAQTLEAPNTFFASTGLGEASSTLKVASTDALASNCWLYVKSIYPNLPNTYDIYTNTHPTVGAVAFFKYGDLNHYAIITKLTEDGFWVKDTNFGGPGYRTHFIAWDNPHIRGFYNPDSSGA